MLVPERGRGEVWQRSVSLRAVRRWLIGGGSVVGLLFFLSLLHVATFSRVVEHDRLVGENLELRARLDTMDRRVAELEPLLQRVRAYDEKLRDLASRQALPGFGPLDADEEAAREAWIAGRAPEPPAGPVGEGDIDAQLARTQARFATVEQGVAALEGHFEDATALLAQWEQAGEVLPQVWPVEGAVLTSPFGWRESPYGPGWKFHSGLDLGVPYGTPIVATNAGLVTFSGWDSGHGNTVFVDHGHGVGTRYCHASRLLVAAGDQVEAGDLIALVGSTGISTGPHLHFELFFDGEQVDPLPYMP